MAEGNENAAPAPGAENAAPAPTAAGWFDSLPEGIRTLPSMEKFKGKDLSGFVSSHIELEKGFGRRIPMPGEKATPDEVAEFREKLGVPREYEKYAEGVRAPTMPEGVPWDKAAHERLTKVAHEEGISPKSMQRLVDEYAKHMVDGSAQVARTSAEAKQKASESLKQEWGAAMERNLAGAAKLVREYGGQELADELDSSGLGNSPQLAKMLARIYEQFAEDGLIGAVQGGFGRDESKAEIARILSDPKGAYWNREDPGHAGAVARMKQLYELAG